MPPYAVDALHCAGKELVKRLIGGRAGARKYARQAATEDGYGSTDFCGNIGELLEVNFFCFFL